jgi:uncharacterized protein
VATATALDDPGRQGAASALHPASRIEAVDALRGVALFGVLAVNLVTEFRVSIFQQFLPSASTASWVDQAVEVFLAQAIHSKAFVLFSLLFGVGLAIQYDRLADSPRRTQLLVRRLVVLLAIGVVHLLLIWNGDILTEYALAGLLALPFLSGSRRLLAGAALAWLGIFAIVPQVAPIVTLPNAEWMAQHVADATRVYGAGSFLEVLAFRIEELPAILPLHVFVFPRTVALFLLGALAWRTGILLQGSADKLLLTGVVIVASIAIAALALEVLSEWRLPARVRFLVEALTPILLALGYAAIVVGIMRLPRGGAIFGWAAPAGRMALTNYLTQSVILGWIFYGYGLGLFGRLGPAAAMAIGVALYAAQAVFSAWWLRRYHYGPVEWLWRALMYGAPPAARRGITSQIPTHC